MLRHYSQDEDDAADVAAADDAAGAHAGINRPPKPPETRQFNVTVAARFRPGRADNARLVLPLHQRLKLLKKGEKLKVGRRCRLKGTSSG